MPATSTAGENKIEGRHILKATMVAEQSKKRTSLIAGLSSDLADGGAAGGAAASSALPACPPLCSDAVAQRLLLVVAAAGSRSSVHHELRLPAAAAAASAAAAAAATAAGASAAPALGGGGGGGSTGGTGASDVISIADWHSAIDGIRDRNRSFSGLGGDGLGDGPVGTGLGEPRPLGPSVQLHTQQSTRAAEGSPSATARHRPPRSTSSRF
jgi:hypothetical protein